MLKSGSSTVGQGILSLSVRDRNALHAAYMPFVVNGGIFVPTRKGYQLGDDVFVLLNLVDQRRKLPISGKVVWLTLHGNTRAGKGIGIQFTEAEVGKTKKNIEEILGDLVKKVPETYSW